MSVFIAILIGFMFFSPHVHKRPVCPSLKPETRSIVRWIAIFKTKDGRTIRIPKTENVGYINTTNATATLESIETENVGEEADLDAIAFNKRVRECQTINGEFNTP